MIYKDSFFNKEMKQAYIEKDVSNRRQIRFGLFMAVGAFAVFFVLQTLTESVLSDAVPEFMMPSYFSTLSVYNNFIYVSMAIYFLVNYQTVTFAEIRMNRWYMLVNMGFNPLLMILNKLLARIASILLVYSIGYVAMVFLTSFLKYPLVTDYFFGMYAAGLIDLITIAAVTMTASLFIRAQATAKYIVLAVASILLGARIASGYYDIVSDRVLMGNVLNLFDLSRSAYMLAVGVLLAGSLAVTVVYANKFAHQYKFPFYQKDLDYGPDVEVVVAEGGRFRPAGRGAALARVQKTILDTVLSIVMAVVMTALLAFNVLVLVMSMSSPGREASVFGVIPYIFRSDTMQPELMNNDLVFFRKLEQNEPVSVDDIVLYTNSDRVGISRIREMGPESITVNVDYYGSSGATDELKEVLTREKIHGRYVGRNRWLGALILFANTLAGRLVFLFVPAFLIFYYKPIFGFIQRFRTNGYYNLPMN